MWEKCDSWWPRCKWHAVWAKKKKNVDKVGGAKYRRDDAGVKCCLWSKTATQESCKREACNLATGGLLPRRASPILSRHFNPGVISVWRISQLDRRTHRTAPVIQLTRDIAPIAHFSLQISLSPPFPRQVTYRSSYLNGFRVSTPTVFA